jgi:HK97 family phage prohead protease
MRIKASRFNPQATKDFRFLIKAVDEKGTFTGLAAVYGNLDLGGDIIAPGAFTKTIREKGGKVPILWQHDQREPIGLGTLEDSAEGLLIHGDLVMESPVAQKAYALMKKEVLKGLSIGYDTIVSEWDSDNEIRTLKEVRLWEVSLVTFPMNPLAQVNDVKAISGELDASVETIADAVSRFGQEIKAGRTLSAATLQSLHASRSAMQEAMDQLQALIDSTESDPAGKSAAALYTAAPDLHAASDRITNLLKGAFS